MNEEMAKEFKIFREQIYNKINELEVILRALKIEDLVAEIVEEVGEDG